MFAAAFVAATLIPFNSEIAFVALQLSQAAPVWLIVLVAAIGNTLGAFVNYWVGATLERHGAHHWLRVPDAGFERARAWWDRWGVWSLLLAFLPVVELTTVVAGAMRTSLWLFGALVALSKTGRYIVLALVTAGLFG